VIVVSDCLSLINKLKAPCRDRSHTGIIVEDIKRLSRASPIVFYFNHVSRKCNQVARVLAKSAGLLCEFWFNVPHEFILPELCKTLCK
jgi:hypothetical protein